MYKNLNAGAIGIRAALPEAIEMAVAHGFGGGDFSISEVAALVKDTSVSAVKDLFERSGVTFGGWGMPVAFTDSDEKWQADLAALLNVVSPFGVSLLWFHCFTVFMFVVTLLPFVCVFFHL